MPVRTPTEPETPRSGRWLLAALAAAAAVIAIAVGIAVLRGGGDQREPLPPSSPEPTASASAQASASPSAVARGFGRPVAAPAAVRDYSASVWTGTEWFFWGGRQDCTGCVQAPVATAVSYDPATQAWSTLPAAPVAGHSAAAVWTGEEVLLYGGLDAAGHDVGPLAFSPSGRTWRRLPAAPIKLRGNTYGPQVVWTGEELVVWGGEPLTPQFTHDPTQPDVGVAYSPATNRWRTLPKAPVSSFRTQYAAVWSGSEVLLWGGGEADGAAYDPASDTWRRLPAAPVDLVAIATYGWTGSELVIWGGRPRNGPEGTGPVAAGAAYDPAKNSWRRLAGSPLAPRLLAAYAAGDGALLVWGGSDGEFTKQYADGALYDATTDSWSPLPALAGTGRDRGPRAVWTGDRFLLLTGRGNTKPTTYGVVSFVP
jgi:N-acetylneuraminic acid mutarotase